MKYNYALLMLLCWVVDLEEYNTGETVSANERLYVCYVYDTTFCTEEYYLYRPKGTG